MAQYLAEKMVLEKRARGSAKRQLSDECADLILKLWAHRHELPDGVRPFGAFEPIFHALSELASDDPRDSLLRVARPKPATSNGMESPIAAALAIDGAARSLIRYTLAQAVDKIPAKDRRWAKLRAALTPSVWETQIVISLIDEANVLVDEKQELKTAAIEELQRMIKNLEMFEGMAQALREQFKRKLSHVSTPSR